MNFLDQKYIEMLEEYFREKARLHNRCPGCTECRRISEIEAEQVRRALVIDD